MPVRVQIAGVSTVDEARVIESAGGDAIGLTLRLPTGVHDGLTEARARSIVAALPPCITTVAITYVRTAREAIDLCRPLGVGALQLHGEFPIGDLLMVRAALPHLKIIRAVHVTGPEVIAAARRLEQRVDALILDTYDPDTGRHGATGKTHDWSISRAIVDAVRVPVMLAGGLNPANVAAAIHAVRPWGVDVHTGVEHPDGRRDFTRIRDFIVRAKMA
ncbi:phosphoribosylanthranilate isomerase [Candidatus Binatia bacterium]|nr:phosphoribosylanthranilate isomerase [Candidatus Binatia bacterium]